LENRRAARPHARASSVWHRTAPHRTRDEHARLECCNLCVSGALRTRCCV